jgi:DNA-binding CsgD family transcriptional regulator
VTPCLPGETCGGLFQITLFQDQRPPASQRRAGFGSEESADHLQPRITGMSDRECYSESGAGLEIPAPPAVFPLPPANFDTWQSTVAASISKLAEADETTFYVPTQPRSPSEHSGAGLPPQLAWIDDGDDVWHRMVAMGAFRADSLFRAITPKSVRRNRVFASLHHLLADVACVAISLRERPSRHEVALLILSRHHTAHSHFKRREIESLRCVLPLLQAGMVAQLELLRQERRAMATIDLIGASVFVSDLRQQNRHFTPALAQMLAAEPCTDQLEREICRLTADLCRQAETGSEEPKGEPKGNGIREVLTPGALYRLRGRIAPEGVVMHHPSVVVTVERSAVGFPSEQQIRDRFGLSQREAMVALLLAQGQSNSRIAATLSISAHTAHHHTERVLLCLRARSRAEVPWKLLL